MAAWFLTVSTASLLPLMIKDGLTVPLLGLTAAFVALTHHYLLPGMQKVARKTPLWVWMRRTYFLSLAGLVLLGGAAILVPPPPKLPDLFPVLLAIYCCGHYIFFCLYFHYCQFTIKYNTASSNNTHTANNNKQQRKVKSN